MRSVRLQPDSIETDEGFCHQPDPLGETIAGLPPPPWLTQFFRVASQMMRRILVDRARARRMQKRSGQWARVTLHEVVTTSRPVDVDVLDLDAALVRLAAFDPRKSQLAELRFFGGLSLKDAGAALGISLATAERDWQAARAWLFKELRRQRST